MLLVIDIGNSNVCLGLWQEDQWRNIWRLPTFQNDLEVYYETQLVNRFLEANVQLMEVTRVVMSSVVPDMNHRMLISLEKLFGMGVILVGPEIYPKIDLQIDNPSEIGTDLVANAVAAYHQFGRDCIIVDFGTALTFTTLTKEGQILGVSIVPGLKTAIKALFTKNRATSGSAHGTSGVCPGEKYGSGHSKRNILWIYRIGHQHGGEYQKRSG